MDRDPHQPLTPSSTALTTEEAKARLRAAAQNVTLSAWIEKHSWTAVAAAVLGGFAAGRLQLSKTVGSVFIQRVAPILLRTFLRRKSAPSDGCSQCADSEGSSLKSK